MKKILIRNTFVYPFKDRASFLDYIKNRKMILVAVNAEKILNTTPKLTKIINENIGYADGIGTVLALKQKKTHVIKIPGSEFWLDIVNYFYTTKSFYLIGSTQDVIEKTVDKLKVNFPDINIIGYRNGYFNDNTSAELMSLIIKDKPEIIFVAQGSPKQEYLMEQLHKVHPALYMGLGGSFDIYCGLKKRAPKFYLNLHLEWFYRLLKEPTRFRRQLVLLKFFILLILNKF